MGVVSWWPDRWHVESKEREGVEDARSTVSGLCPGRRRKVAETGYEGGEAETKSGVSRRGSPDRA